MRSSHEIHTSELRSFMSCRRRWNWAHRRGYVTQAPPTYFEFGIAYHKAMETFFDPHTWHKTTAGEKKAAAQQVFEATCESHRKSYLETMREPRLTREQADLYDEQIELGLGMIGYYAGTVHPVADDWFEPVATEIPFSIPLPDPDQAYEQPLVCRDSPLCGQKHMQGAPVTYDGTADAVVRDLEFGGLYVWDHKSAGQLQSNADYLYLDDQVGGYSMAMRHVLDLDIRGFVYAEHRKAFPTPPRELSKPNAGKLLSTDKRQLTDFKVFVDTAQVVDPGALGNGLYDEYLDFLQSRDAPAYHRRFDIGKSPEEMEACRMTLADRAAEMVNGRVRIYPEPSKMSCGFCPYYQPCLGTYMGEDVQYTLDTMFEKVEAA